MKLNSNAVYALQLVLLLVQSAQIPFPSSFTVGSLVQLKQARTLDLMTDARTPKTVAGHRASTSKDVIDLTPHQEVRMRPVVEYSRGMTHESAVRMSSFGRRSRRAGT